MNISSALQQHYQRKKILSIDNSLDVVRDKFVQLSMTEIVCGHLFNPFTSRYKLKIRCDQDTIWIDGPYGMKIMPLTTKVELQASMIRDCTILNLIIQFPTKYINSHLIVTLILCVMTLLLPAKSLITMFILIWSYLLSWIYFNYSSKIILKYLSNELAAVDQA